jgi:hypothetical protein
MISRRANAGRNVSLAQRNPSVFAGAAHLPSHSIAPIIAANKNKNTMVFRKP